MKLEIPTAVLRKEVSALNDFLGKEKKTSKQMLQAFMSRLGKKREGERENEV